MSGIENEMKFTEDDEPTSLFQAPTLSPIAQYTAAAASPRPKKKEEPPKAEVGLTNRSTSGHAKAKKRE